MFEVFAAFRSSLHALLTLPFSPSSVFSASCREPSASGQETKPLHWTRQSLEVRTGLAQIVSPVPLLALCSDIRLPFTSWPSFGRVGVRPTRQGEPQTQSGPGSVGGSATSPSAIRPATHPLLAKASEGDLGPGLMAVTVWGKVQPDQEGQL